VNTWNTIWKGKESMEGWAIKTNSSPGLVCKYDERLSEKARKEKRLN
jgi:hypothetical protein